MDSSRRRLFTWTLSSIAMLVAPFANAAVPNSFVINEANTVSGTMFLDEDNRNRADATLGRLQGNGQNWIEFLVVQGDELGGGAFKNTLDLRGWKLEWSYDKNDPLDPNKFGSGTIQFTNDPLWAAVPRGTLLTINEWKKAWYHNAGTDPAGFGGLQRDGGINGLGTQKGDPEVMGFHSPRDFSTNTRWNPNAGGGGASADWVIHVWAGERNLDSSFKYFTFSGSIVNADPNVSNPIPIPIGTENGGLYALNNDNWQWTIKDAANNVIQGPNGEALSNGGWSLNSQEIFRLENFAANANPTLDTYLGVINADYQDGSSSAFGLANIWSGGSFVQDLSPLRNWLKPGDVDLDGRVSGHDFLAWQRGVGMTILGVNKPSLTDGNLNGDDNVNTADLNLWKSNFGSQAVATVSAVPECSSVISALVSFVLCSGVNIRRHRTN